MTVKQCIDFHTKKSPSSSDLFRFSQATLTPTHIKVKERTKRLSCFEKGWPDHFDRKKRYLERHTEGSHQVVFTLPFLHSNATAKL